MSCMLMSKSGAGRSWKNGYWDVCIPNICVFMYVVMASSSSSRNQKILQPSIPQPPTPTRPTQPPHPVQPSPAQPACPANTVFLCKEKYVFWTSAVDLFEDATVEFGFLGGGGYHAPKLKPPRSEKKKRTSEVEGGDNHKPNIVLRLGEEGRGCYLLLPTLNLSTIFNVFILFSHFLLSHFSKTLLHNVSLPFVRSFSHVFHLSMFFVFLWFFLGRRISVFLFSKALLCFSQLVVGVLWARCPLGQVCSRLGVLAPPPKIPLWKPVLGSVALGWLPKALDHTKCRVMPPGVTWLNRAGLWEPSGQNNMTPKRQNVALSVVQGLWEPPWIHEKT